MITPKRGLKSQAMAALMDEIDEQMKGLRKGFNPGEKVRGTVISVTDDYIVLDVNSKLQGVIDTNQWDVNIPLPEPNDVIDVYFVEVRDGSARFTVNSGSSGAAANQSILQAYTTKLPVEGKIEKEINGGYEVIVCGQRGFCPYSQISLYKRRDEPNEAYIGKVMNFLVMEYEPEERTLVVSHRALLERDRDDKRNALKATLAEGDQVTGKVTKIMPFGAFVDIGGIEGLIPLRQLSWNKNTKPQDVLSEGQQVSVTIISLDWDNDRFSFSLLDAKEDPWNLFEAEFDVGSYVTGKITKLVQFGVFVELECGVEGFVHVSKLGLKYRISSPSLYFKLDQQLDLQIENIDFDERKISLRVVDVLNEDEAADKEADEAAQQEIAARDYIAEAKKKSSSFGSFADVFSKIDK
jgi:small subunit ribosomal protein S1